LLTPTPDMQEGIVNSDAELGNYANQIIVIAKKYNIGLVDSYNLFKKLEENRKSLKEYMAHSNHPNQLGHQLVANEICKLFGLK